MLLPFGEGVFIEIFPGQVGQMAAMSGTPGSAAISRRQLRPPFTKHDRPNGDSRRGCKMPGCATEIFDLLL
jgi:hypothetical protein